MGGFAENEVAMSPASESKSLLDHFSALKDPRQSWRVLYPLPEILLLVLCGTLSGMEDFVEVALWGKERLAFLRRFLPYERGIPSHDALNDLFNALDAALFRDCFATWVETLRDTDPEIIAIDGKTSRRSHARSKGRMPLHLVSAWASRQRLVLGQEAVADKSNEITAIPLLLKRLELTGALVTIDAMGTQIEIAKTIVEGGGDYLLSLKANWPASSPRSRPSSPIPKTGLPASRPTPPMAIMAGSRSAAISSATRSTGSAPTAASPANATSQSSRWSR